MTISNVARNAWTPVVHATIAVIICAGIPATLGSCCGLSNTCTLIGCNDGLQIEVGGDIPLTPVTVEATSDTGERRVAQCEHDDFCFLVFEGCHPEVVTFRISWEGGIKTLEAQPEYEVSQPNGRCCPPTCRSTTVAITI